MTLWDKQPLTAEEVTAREVCACGHMRWQHGKHTHPHGTSETVCAAAWCGCEEFTKKEADVR